MTNSGPDPVDELLVMRAQDGDGRSMDDLIRRWQKRLWAHACHLTGSTDAAWDVTQQAWMAIIRGLRTLHDPAHFRAWAYRIVANKVADHLKSRPPVEPAADEAIEQEEARQEDEVILRELLNRLEPDKKAILLLYYIEGLTLPELAFVLGVPEGTVKSRLHAAREQFRKMWQQRAGGSANER